MSKAGEVYENPVTGEWSVVRLGIEESDGGQLVIDLYVARATRWLASTSTRTSRKSSLLLAER